MSGPVPPLGSCAPAWRLDGERVVAAGPVPSSAGGALPAAGAGRWLPEERRVAWDWAALGVAPALRAAAEAEAAEFDAWAESQRAGVLAMAPQDADGRRYGAAAWRAVRPAIAMAERASGVRIRVGGARILVIGGSAYDATHWIPEAPARIDLVDVSPGTQRLGLLRLARVHGRAGADRAVFHTVPAEHLPFADAAFDVVFSWSSLHHCARPRAFEEALRVLAPGGVLAILDRYLSGPLQRAMRARRRALGLERGTDRPLSAGELAGLAARLEEGFWAPFGADRLIGYLGAKIGIGAGDRARPARRIGGPVERLLGRDAVLIGVKPGAAAA